MNQLLQVFSLPFHLSRTNHSTNVERCFFPPKNKLYLEKIYNIYIHTEQEQCKNSCDILSDSTSICGIFGSVNKLSLKQAPLHSCGPLEWYPFPCMRGDPKVEICYAFNLSLDVIDQQSSRGLMVQIPSVYFCLSTLCWPLYFPLGCDRTTWPSRSKGKIFGTSSATFAAV